MRGAHGLKFYVVATDNTDKNTETKTISSF